MSEYQLPPSREETGQFTFDAPNQLLLLMSKNDQPVVQIRFGGAQQVPIVTRLEWVETPVKEAIFRVRSTNRISVGRDVVTVINDEREFGDTKLPATDPSNSEYANLIGKPVQWSFRCEPDAQQSKLAGRDIYRITRSTFILP